jgi:hypothetical protein
MNFCGSQITHPYKVTKKGVFRLFTKTYFHYILLLYIISLTFFSSNVIAYMLFEADRPLYVGSRPLSMGNAFVAIADNAESGFWNPAGLTQRQGIMVFASTKLWDRDTNAFDSKSVVYCYRNTAFSWGNKIALRVKSGDTPDFNYYSLAQKLNSYVSIGGSVKFKRKHPSDYYQFFGYSPGYDFGILFKPELEDSFGLLIQRLSGEKKLINVITIGLCHKVLDNLSVSFDLAILSKNENSVEKHIGWEYEVNNWVIIRAGGTNKSPTVGLGLQFGRFEIDYALIRESKRISSFISGQVKL